MGAILVKDNRIISTGYNGAASGQPHCIDVGCLTNEAGRHCERAIHAETNAVAQAAKFSGGTDGCTMYFYDSRGRDVLECPNCYKLMKASGIAVVINKDLVSKILNP